MLEAGARQVARTAHSSCTELLSHCRGRHLGGAYCDGKCVEQDHVEARKARKARKAGKAGKAGKAACGKEAKAGFAAVQCNLRVIYLKGKGVEEDVGEALKWAQLAAVQGYEDALEVLSP